MQLVPFGRTGLLVSRLSLGTVELGLDYGIGGRRPEPGDAARLLHRALDLGLNLIDTARLYGTAEEVIGAALAERRAEFILTTKALPDPATLPDSLETSLRALRTDVIDILMLHSATREAIDRGDATDALLRAREQGKVRFLGASVYGEDAAVAAIRTGVFDCLQVAYSALDRRPEAALLADAHAAGVAIQARSVLLKGVLTDRRHQLPAELAPLSAAADALAALAPLPLPELAYRYALSQTPPETILVGTADLSELEQAVAWIERGPLEPSLIARIRALPSPDAHWLNPAHWPAL